MTPPRPTEKRVTLTEIARRCGYHPSTISLALRRHPSIPEATREKIRRAAEEMGYRPDPALASLIAYRSSKRSQRAGTAIAVISDHEGPPSAWREIHPTYISYWKGMSEQAAKLGYALTEFTIGHGRDRTERINDILEARGITAAVVVPMSNLDEPIELDWSRLSAVALGYTLPSPALPRVTHAHHFGAMLAVEELYKLGYRRIALALPFCYDQRVHHGWSAGYLAGVQLHAPELEPLIYMPQQTYCLLDTPIRLWLERNKPDVIITAQFQLLRYLQAIGYGVPSDIGYVFLDCEREKASISGIVQNSVEIGRQAINVVSSAFINYCRGVPEHEESHLINGFWQKGETVREQAAARVKAVETVASGAN